MSIYKVYKNPWVMGFFSFFLFCPLDVFKTELEAQIQIHYRAARAAKKDDTAPDICIIKELLNIDIVRSLVHSNFAMCIMWHG